MYGNPKADRCRIKTADHRNAGRTRWASGELINKRYCRQRAREREREGRKELESEESEENRAREEGLDSRTVALMHVKRAERVRRQTRRYSRSNKTAKLSACPTSPEPSQPDCNPRAGRALDRPRQYSKEYE